MKTIPILKIESRNKYTYPTQIIHNNQSLQVHIMHIVFKNHGTPALEQPHLALIGNYTDTDQPHPLRRATSESHN